MGDLRRRIARIWHEWPIGVTLMCEIVMVFIGFALLVDPFLHTIPDSSPWLRWGETGAVTLGAIFLVLGTYGALYRERQTGLIPTFLLCVLGLSQSIHPFNLIGIAWYALFLTGGIADAHERRVRQRLRNEWTVMVPGNDGA